MSIYNLAISLIGMRYEVHNKNGLTVSPPKKFHYYQGAFSAWSQSYVS